VTEGRKEEKGEYASAQHSIKYVEHCAKSLPQEKKVDRHTTTDTEASEPCMQNGDPTPRRRVPERKTKNRRQAGCRLWRVSPVRSSVMQRI
jgi:hypothetical protein